MLPFYYLTSEKITAETLFKGLDFDLQAASDLLKSLSEYNPSVWNYILTITKQVTQPIAIAILAVMLLIELSQISRKLSVGEGIASFEVFAPLILKLLMISIAITNTTLIIGAIVGIGSYALEKVVSIVARGGVGYDTISGLSGKGVIGKFIVAFFGIFIFLARVVSFVIVNLFVTIRFIQLYLMVPFAPIATATLLNDEWRSIGIGYYKNVIVYVVQGVLIFIVLSFTALFKNSAANYSGFEALGALVGSVAQAILLVIAVVSTQRTARSIMGM